jgi:putative FmdB family regulatory protein
MPIYEFHCSACKRDSEVLVRSSEWQGTRCPHCGSTRLDKKFSVFASAAVAVGAGEAPACSMNASSCCRCSGRGPHSH